MNEIKLKNAVKWNIEIALLVMIILSIISCAQRVPFTISSVVPAAEGFIKVKKDNNHNYNIDMSVIHLVDPARLTPTKKGYIVWMQTETNGVLNIGQLKSFTGMMSNTRKSSLTTVTPFKPTGFFITGEDNLSTEFPGSVVLSSNSFSVR